MKMERVHTTTAADHAEARDRRVDPAGQHAAARGRRRDRQPATRLDLFERDIDSVAHDEHVERGVGAPSDRRARPCARTTRRPSRAARSGRGHGERLVCAPHLDSEASVRTPPLENRVDLAIERVRSASTDGRTRRSRSPASAARRRAISAASPRSTSTTIRPATERTPPTGRSASTRANVLRRRATKWRRCPSFSAISL